MAQKDTSGRLDFTKPVNKSETMKSIVADLQNAQQKLQEAIAEKMNERQIQKLQEIVKNLHETIKRNS